MTFDERVTWSYNMANWSGGESRELCNALSDFRSYGQLECIKDRFKVIVDPYDPSVVVVMQ